MTSTDISEFVTLPRSEYDALKLRGNTYRKRALCLAQQAARFRQTGIDAPAIGELILRAELGKVRAERDAALRRAEEAETHAAVWREQLRLSRVELDEFTLAAYKAFVTSLEAKQ